MRSGVQNLRCGAARAFLTCGSSVWWHAPSERKTRPQLSARTSRSLWRSEATPPALASAGVMKLWHYDVTGRAGARWEADGIYDVTFHLPVRTSAGEAAQVSCRFLSGQRGSEVNIFRSPPPPEVIKAHLVITSGSSSHQHLLEAWPFRRLQRGRGSLGTSMEQAYAPPPPRHIALKLG